MYGNKLKNKKFYGQQIKSKTPHVAGNKPEGGGAKLQSFSEHDTTGNETDGDSEVKRVRKRTPWIFQNAG
jgi:hypothetical protein